MYAWIFLLFPFGAGITPALPHDLGSAGTLGPLEPRAAAVATSLLPASHVLAAAVSADTTPPPDAWFAEDKLRHFFLSFAVTGMAFGAIRTTGLDGAPALVAAGAVAAAAGLWKEFYDRSIGRPFSRKDLVWDGLGIAAGLILASQAR